MWTSAKRGSGRNSSSTFRGRNGTSVDTGVQRVSNVAPKNHNLKAWLVTENKSHEGEAEEVLQMQGEDERREDNSDLDENENEEGGDDNSDLDEEEGDDTTRNIEVSCVYLMLQFLSCV